MVSWERGRAQGVLQELFVDHIWSPFWGSCISVSKPAKVTWDRDNLLWLLVGGTPGLDAWYVLQQAVSDFVDVAIFLVSSIITLHPGDWIRFFPPLPSCSSCPPLPLPSSSLFHLAIPIRAVKLSTTERGLKRPII